MFVPRKLDKVKKVIWLLDLKTLAIYLPFVLSIIPSLSCNTNSLQDDWVVIIAMTLNASLCLGPDWIIYAWVKWSVVKLLESSAISISATTSFKGHDLCLVVWYQLKRVIGRWKQSTGETWRQTDKWRIREKKGNTTKKQKREWQSCGRYTLFVSARRVKCQFLCCISDWWLPLPRPMGISRQY